MAVAVKKLVIVLSVIVISTLLIGLSTYFLVQKGENGTTNHTVSLSGSEEEIANITYCNIDGYSEEMNIYTPSAILNNHSASEYPVVMYIHGGGWVYGTKDSNWKGIFPHLLQKGFIVASINYFMPSTPGSVPPFGYPLNVEDAACAVRFLHYSANEYHIDPNHIGLLGDSAGGNLVSLESLSAMNGTFDSIGQYTGYSSQVQAVVDAFGPANLTAQPFFGEFNETFLMSYGPQHFDLFADVFGGSNTNMIDASPVNYVTSQDPPFLILQGENDTLVPMSQSVNLYNDLLNHNDRPQLILVQNAGHEFAQVDPNIPINPNQSTISSDIANFFVSSL